MNFTQHCFVRVQDAEKRKELYDWCVSIGYIAGFYPTPNRHVTAGHTSVFGYRMISENRKPLIDCGTNIDLFKALAAMNDENDKEQWFVDTSGEFGWTKCEKPTFRAWLSDGLNKGNITHLFRKATAEEIIEHFKNQKS
jgi:hypothetical protein